MNPYIYAVNDPITNWDPTGLYPMCDGPCSSSSKHKGSERPAGLTLAAGPPSSRAIWYQEMKAIHGERPVPPQCRLPVYDPAGAGALAGSCRSMAPFAGEHPVGDAFAARFYGPCYQSTVGECAPDWAAAWAMAKFGIEWIVVGKVASVGGRLLFRGAGRLWAAKFGKAPRSTGAIDDAISGFCSFAATTAVFMADGTTKPIADIEVGDWVLAEDPETGERGPRKVTKLWVHTDAVVDLKVDGDVVTTTDDHPFWNATDEAWQLARDLDRGDLLLAADGDRLRVDSLVSGSARSATAYNLTIDGLHTYFVGIGADHVLVHNDCLPGIDGTGRIHGPLPSRVPDSWTVDDLLQVQDDLVTSIASRQGNAARLGLDTGHGRRLNEEIELLRQIQKILSGS